MLNSFRITRMFTQTLFILLFDKWRNNYIINMCIIARQAYNYTCFVYKNDINIETVPVNNTQV